MLKISPLAIKAFNEKPERTGKNISEVAKRWEELGLSTKYFTQDFFTESLTELKAAGMIEFEDIQVNLKHKRKDITDEFDIVMYNGDSIAIVEVKYVAAASDLKNLIEKKAPNFKYLYPEYAGYKIYLGLAGLSFDNENIKQLGSEAGIAILEAKGDHAEIIADNMKAY